MDGFFALLFGVAGVAFIAWVPNGWLKAAGGLLILLIVFFIATDALRLLR